MTVKIDKAGCWLYEVYYLMLEIFHNLITLKKKKPKIFPKRNSTLHEPLNH